MKRYPIWLMAAAAALLPALAMAQNVSGDTPPPPSVLDDFFRMPPTQLWAILLGMMTPAITAVINRVRWASDIKLAVWLAVCIITTAITVLIRGDISGRNYLSILLVILVFGALTYQATKPAIKTIEVRTDPTVSMRSLETRV